MKRQTPNTIAWALGRLDALVDQLDSFHRLEPVARESARGAAVVERSKRDAAAIRKRLRRLVTWSRTSPIGWRLT